MADDPRHPKDEALPRRAFIQAAVLAGGAAIGAAGCAHSSKAPAGPAAPKADPPPIWLALSGAMVTGEDAVLLSAASTGATRCTKAARAPVS